MIRPLSKWTSLVGTLTVVGLALGPLACATAAPATQAPPPAPVVVRRVVVDVGALFPAATSRTFVDVAAVKPALLARVALERNALTGTDGVDPWLARALLAYLVSRGGVVVDDAEGASARLVGVRFGQGDDEIPVVVVKEDDAFLVRNRITREDESMCEADLKVKIGYVQLETTVVDESHRVVAEVAEVVAATPRVTQVGIDIVSDDDVCARLAGLMLEELAPGEDELLKAAEQALTTGMATIAQPL